MGLNDYRLFRSYQEAAQKYAKYSTPDYPFMGLVEETGETIGKLAKASRKTEISLPFLITNIKQHTVYFEELKKELVKELGDVLLY
jgi:NTP pyrophosphatase (non-canonical NTP hydrolase)